jgi:hypothetical protein
MRRICGGVAGSVAVIAATLLAVCGIGRAEMARSHAQAIDLPVPVLPQRALLVRSGEETVEEPVEARSWVISPLQIASLLLVLSAAFWIASRGRGLLQSG